METELVESYWPDFKELDKDAEAFVEIQRITQIPKDMLVNLTFNADWFFDY